MQTIRFNTVISKEQIIRPPADIVLPKGPIEVIIRPIVEDTRNRADPLAKTRTWLLALPEEAEGAAPDLPSDLAEHHDHCAHGKPLP